MGMNVSPEMVSAFEREGVVLIRGALDAEWLARLGAAVERACAKPGPYYYRLGATRGFHLDKLAWRTDPDVAAYAKDSPLPALAAALLRARKVNLFCDQLFAKDPGAVEAETPWHQDQVIFPVEGRQTVSFWTSLDPVTRETGAIEFIAGSHLWGKMYQPYGFDGRPAFGVVESYEQVTPDFGAERDRHEFRCWDMEPGDVVAFSFLTLHYAAGNAHGTRPRRAFTLRYTGDDVVYRPNAASTPAYLVPGLVPGRPLDSAEYPVVWQAAAIR